VVSGRKNPALPKSENKIAFLFSFRWYTSDGRHTGEEKRYGKRVIKTNVQKRILELLSLK
jgi:hypothetical protein